MSSNVQRVVAWFSCGVASAVAAKWAVDTHGDKCDVVYCNLLQNEHPDNVRFMADIERWIGRKITIIKSERYASVDEVFENRKYLAGPRGAPCTVEMKKKPRFAYQRADDVHIFGFTADEKRRINAFVKNNPDLHLDWPLLRLGITKKMCMVKMSHYGIELPIRYRLGFKNNNCLACVKASSLSYWVLTRRVDPEAFARRADQSRRFGARLVKYKGERIFLDEIPVDDQIDPKFLKQSKMENISCGPECSAR